MMTISQNLNAPTALNVGSFRPLAYDLAIVPQGTVSGSNPAADLYENKMLTATGSGVWQKPVFSFPLSESYSLESLTPETASVSEGNVSIVGTGGQCVYKVEREGIKSLVRLNNATSSKVVTYFDGYVEGSVARILSDAVLGRISGTEQMNLFTNWTTLGANAPAPTLTRNTNCWAHGLDLSGVSIGTTLFGSWTSANKGALITKRHVVAAHHWLNYTGGFIGMKFRFLSVDNIVYERTVVGKDVYDDIEIYTLDADLPSTVRPLKVVGPWFARNRVYTPSFYRYDVYNGGTFFYVDQLYNCRLTSGRSFNGLFATSGSLSGVTYGGITFPDFVQTANFLADTSFSGHIPSIFSGKESYFQEGIVGDSGSPVMAIVGGLPAVVCTWLSGQHAPFLGNSEGAFVNRMVELSDINAGTTTGTAVTPGGAGTLTVTVAPSPI